MPDPELPPLVDLARKARGMAAWADRVQSDKDDAYGLVPASEAAKHRGRLSAEIALLEQAIARAREVL